MPFGLIREDVLQLDWLPEFHYGRYKMFIHNLPNDEAIDNLDKVEPPATLMLGYDIPTGKRVWMLAGTDQMPDGTASFRCAATLLRPMSRIFCATVFITRARSPCSADRYFAVRCGS